MSNEAKALWYVIHTYSGYENKVAANIQRMIETRGLQDLIFETRIPTEIVMAGEPDEDEDEEYEEESASLYDFDDENETESKPKKRVKREKKEQEHKLFPSYVLVKMVMNDETWHVVRNIRGCTGFVGPGSKPVPLTDKEVEALGVEVRVRKLAYAVGDSVMVVAGFLAGALATVKEIHEDTGRIKVDANIDGREAVVELNMSDVEPVKD